MSVKPISRAVAVSSEARQFAQQNIDVINTLVKQGKVTVDDQLLIHPVGESRSVWVQSWNWWGAQIAVDNGSTQQLINSLKGNNLSNAINMFRSAVNGQMLNIVIALLKMAWGWTIEYVNNSGGQHGVYVNVTWTTFMWVTPR